MRRLWALAVLVAAAWWMWVSFVPIRHPSGVLIPQEPEQLMLRGPQEQFSKRGWTLTPLAFYSIQARVLAKEHYSGDPSAKLVPYDVAVGWGPMSDTAVLDQMDIRQSYRFYRWQYWGASPVPEKDIVSHSANMHLIADNEDVRAAIAALRVGSLVAMRGYLVEARHPSGLAPWRSSLRRDDAGDGACEVMLVRSLREL